jgi:hypothetical protein
MLYIVEASGGAVEWDTALQAKRSRVRFPTASCRPHYGHGFDSASKGGYTLVTLPRTVTPYRDSVDGTRDHVTYQKLVTR